MVRTEAGLQCPHPAPHQGGVGVDAPAVLSVLSGPRSGQEPQPEMDTATILFHILCEGTKVRF